MNTWKMVAISFLSAWGMFILLARYDTLRSVSNAVINALPGPAPEGE
jgi:hypothetical protein